MALNIRELDAITKEMYLPVMTDQIFESHPLLKMMRERKQTVSGTAINVPLRHERLNSGGYGAGSTFDISKKEIFTSATFGMRGGYVNVTFDGFENALNAGSETQVLNIIDEKMKAAQEDAQELMVEMLFGDNNGISDTKFTGLGAALRDDNTYGGINRAATKAVDGYDGKFWAAKVFENGGTKRAITLQLLQQAFMEITKGGLEAKDTVITCSYDVYNKIHDLLMDKFRVVNPHPKMMEFGFQSISYNGVAILPEAFLIDNDIRFVNLKHFQMRTNKERDFHLTDFKTAQNSDSQVKQLLIAGNFVTSKASSLGIIKDLDPAL